MFSVAMRAGGEKTRAGRLTSTAPRSDSLALSTAGQIGPPENAG